MGHILYRSVMFDRDYETNGYGTTLEGDGAKPPGVA